SWPPSLGEGRAQRFVLRPCRTASASGALPFDKSRPWSPHEELRQKANGSEGFTLDPFFKALYKAFLQPGQRGWASCIFKQFEFLSAYSVVLEPLHRYSAQFPLQRLLQFH